MGDQGWSNSGRDWQVDHVQDRGHLDFVNAYPPYSGSAEDYQKEHARLYGGAERLDPDGRHVRVDGSHEPFPSFPRGSSRERAHRVYDNSTQQRKQTRDAFNAALTEEKRQFELLDEDQQEYYKHTSKGLVPSTHARLIPLARRYDEDSDGNAKGRLKFLHEHGNVAYHTLTDGIRHRKWAEAAVNEHTVAHQARVLHTTHRPRPHDATKLDCYSNDPVWNHSEHPRSRIQGLPPPDTYCSRLRTPSPSGPESELENNGHQQSISQQQKPASGGKRGRPRRQLLMGNPGPLGGREYCRR